MKHSNNEHTEDLNHIADEYELLAKPTLFPDENSKLVNVYIVKPDSSGSSDKIRHRMWVHDLLDDFKIPYHIEIKSFSPSKNKTVESQWIFVEEEHSIIVLALFKQYGNPENLIFSEEEITEEYDEDSYIDGIPQKKCPTCGEIVDFDYYKCPNCKAKLA